MWAPSGMLAAFLLLLSCSSSCARLIVFSQQMAMTGVDPSAESASLSQDEERVPAVQHPAFSWIMWRDQQQHPHHRSQEEGLTVEEAMVRSIGCSRLHAALRDYQNAQLLDHLLTARAHVANTEKFLGSRSYEQPPLRDLDALEAAAATTADYNLAFMSGSNQHHGQAASAASSDSADGLELMHQADHPRCHADEQQGSGHFVDMIDDTDVPQPDLRTDVLLSRHYDQDMDYVYADSTSLQTHNSILQLMTHVLDTLLSRAEAVLRLDSEADGVDYDQYSDMDTTLSTDALDVMDSADAVDTLDDWAANPLLRTSYWSLSRQPALQPAAAKPAAYSAPQPVQPHEATEDECEIGLVLLVFLLLATAGMMVGFIRNAVALRHAMVAGPSARRDLLLPLVFEHEGRQYMVLLDETAVQGTNVQHGKGKGSWGPVSKVDSLQDEKAMAQADWKQAKDQRPDNEHTEGDA